MSMSVLAVRVITLEPVMTLSTDLVVPVWQASQETNAKPVNVMTSYITLLRSFEYLMT